MMIKFTQKIIVLTSLFFVLLPITQASTSELSCGTPPERIYLLRHTEQVDNTGNSPLSEEGHARAKALIDVIGNDAIQTIYTTESIRTVETATPLASHKGIKIQQIPRVKYDKLMSEICNNNSGKTIVVVGQWGNLKVIIPNLGVEFEYPDYGKLFVVDFKDGKPSLTTEWFGNK
ncbi:MAG: phosphoglycerate mutase family protein [Desulfobulbia bacterium]